MTRRPPAVVALAVALAVVMSGCTGSPAPTPSTPTPLTEEQAFAAAEETYRAYVDALNQVDLSDPETFEPVYALTTGEANADFRKSFSQMSADGWTVDGVSVPTVVEPGEATSTSASLLICIDVSAVTVVDHHGQSQVHADRRDVQPMTIRLEGHSSESWKIAKFDNRDGEPTCDE